MTIAIACTSTASFDIALAFTRVIQAGAKPIEALGVVCEGYDLSQSAVIDRLLSAFGSPSFPRWAGFALDQAIDEIAEGIDAL